MAEELVPFEDKFAVLKYQPNELKQVLAENIGGESLSEFDLDRVKVPSGGGTSWEVPTLKGIENTPVLEGIVVHWGNRRAFWPEQYSGGDEPPQCNSPDGIFGYGDPGDELRSAGRGCAECPFSAFGSADDGVGQACKATRQLFLLQPDSLIPLVVTLPPASLANAKKYFLRLVRAGIPVSGVVTRLALVKDKSKSGITYSKVELVAGDVLPEDAAKKIGAYAEALKPSFQRAAQQVDDLR